ncbi:hypothetical protein BKA70DRAFT_1537895 [Coprinopsis sp. MPI-PUGE-AT-0042]|nr:hypothetical protein BKA70DRAFT_1537895 [Coprinopsis sp. MPI-PUGE-AT-0042]
MNTYMISSTIAYGSLVPTRITSSISSSGDNGFRRATSLRIRSNGDNSAGSPANARGKSSHEALELLDCLSNPRRNHRLSKLVRSLRDLAAQYERDRSQLEASIHLYTCAGSTTRLLPDELLLKIFSYLSGTSQKARPFVDCIEGSTMAKIAAALSCRRWKHITFDYPELWSSLRVDCSSFQHTKLKALPTTIPGLDRYIARAQMSKKMDIELITWDCPLKRDIEKDSELLKAQIKLLPPLPMMLMANWSTLTIRAQHVSALLNLWLFQPWTFPNLTNLTIMGVATYDQIGGNVHAILWGASPFQDWSLSRCLA